jgi:hypothetical protein
MLSFRIHGLVPARACVHQKTNQEHNLIFTVPVNVIPQVVRFLVI